MVVAAPSVPRPPFTVAVNLSLAQCRNGDLARTTGRALRASGLEPRWLELEVTESLFLYSDNGHIDGLRRFRKQGVRVSLDDFGTGYSSLGRLRQLPVDKIKIDGSFVAGVGRNPDSEAIVRAVIRLGRSLGLRVVAEGVETNVQCALFEGRAAKPHKASTSPDHCRRAISRLYSGKIAARFIDFTWCCSRTARGSRANSIDALARGIRQVALSWTIPAQRPFPHTSGSVSASAAEEFRTATPGLNRAAEGKQVIILEVI